MSFSTIEGSGDYSLLYQGNRHIHRNDTGDLYVVVLDINGARKIQVFKSTDNGVTWTLRATKLVVSTRTALSSAMRSDGDIEICFLETDTGAGTFGMIGVRYLDATQTFSAEDAVAALGTAAPTCPSTAITVDIANTVHVAFADTEVARGGPLQTTRYAQKTVVQFNFQVWSSRIANRFPTDIIVEKTNSKRRPLIAVRKCAVIGNIDIGVYQGDTNDPTSFLAKEFGAVSFTQTVPPITRLTEDNEGRIWLCFKNISSRLAAFRHNDTDTWATWSSAIAIESGTAVRDASIAARGPGKNVNDVYFTFISTGNVYSDYGNFHEHQDGDNWSNPITSTQTGVDFTSAKSQSHWNNGGANRIDAVRTGTFSGISYSAFDINQPSGFWAMAMIFVGLIPSLIKYRRGYGKMGGI